MKTPALLLSLLFAHAALGADMAGFSVTSTSYQDGSEVPQKFTCEGGDASPQIAWSGLPAGTKSIALIVDDPDAPDPAKPERTWVHWVVYDIPATTQSIAEGTGAAPNGARVGKNDWNKTTWGGPCPPIGRHRYFHKIFALDVVLGDLKEPTKAQLEAAMKGHILAQAQLVATYEKKKK
jgi:Raf kinase inhibitor-like YbhB/YbcL family protein